MEYQVALAAAVHAYGISIDMNGIRRTYHSYAMIGVLVSVSRRLAMASSVQLQGTNV